MLLYKYYFIIRHIFSKQDKILYGGYTYVHITSSEVKILTFGIPSKI